MEHIVIIGGGFGGLSFLKKARKSNNKFTLIDKTNHHLFQPLLYQVATAVLSPADITVPIRNLFKHDKNVTIKLGEVVDIRKDSKKVILQNGDEIDYDKLLISTGASYSYFGNDEWGAYSNGLKNINDALDIRDKILKAFEKAENEIDKVIRQRYLNFVVIGGGPTGVELAGSIAEIAFKNINKEFRNFNSNDSKVYLIEAGTRILPAFSPKLSFKARIYLEKLGVTVKTGEKVENIEEMIVTTDKGEIISDNIIWAAGNKASSLIEKLDTDTDSEGERLLIKIVPLKMMTIFLLSAMQQTLKIRKVIHYQVLLLSLYNREDILDQIS